MPKTKQPESQQPESLYVVKRGAGHDVKIIKHGRRWLYLKPKYGWDAPRVDSRVLDGRSCNVEGWYNCTAWESKSHYDECMLRDRTWKALRAAVQNKYTPPEDILTPELQEAARLLMVHVDA